MKKVIINENQRGLLFKNGRFIKMLSSGKYHTFKNSFIEVVPIENSLKSDFCSLETLLLNEELANSVSVAEVGDCELALHFVNGKLWNVLPRGKYAYWSLADKHEYQLVDISTPDVGDDVPEYIFSKIPASYFTKVEVAEYEKSRLYFNQKFVRILDAGTYYFWKNGTAIDTGFVDTRLTQLNITGQEILNVVSDNPDIIKVRDTWIYAVGE